MNKSAWGLGLMLVVGGAVSAGCDGDDDTTGTTSGAGHGGSSSGGKSGSSTGGKAGSAVSGGSSGASAKGGTGGTTSGTSGASGASGESGGPGGGGMTSSGGTLGSAGAGAGGEGAQAGTQAGAGAEAGTSGGGGAGGADTSGEMIARGAYLVRSVALCGGCHTPSGGAELSGNPAFKGGALPAPNLTPDATGLGTWTDDQIKNAFRNGVDDEARHLDPAMPYWLFHNITDDDASAIVAFLRSLPPVSAAVGEANPDATPVTPFSLSAFPDSTLGLASPDYAAAQQGKYLMGTVAQCVKCHSPSSSGLPIASFFSGVAPTSGTQIFAPNITPDATGLTGWTAGDVATALKVGTNKAGVTLCGSMPSAGKGYGGLTEADATAIGVYLTTIPAVSNAPAEPSLEPTCPP